MTLFQTVIVAFLLDGLLSCTALATYLLHGPQSLTGSCLVAFATLTTALVGHISVALKHNPALGQTQASKSLTQGAIDQAVTRSVLANGGLTPETPAKDDVQ